MARVAYFRWNRVFHVRRRSHERVKNFLPNTEYSIILRYIRARLLPDGEEEVRIMKFYFKFWFPDCIF